LEKSTKWGRKPTTQKQSKEKHKILFIFLHGTYTTNICQQFFLLVESNFLVQFGEYYSLNIAY